MANLNTTIKKGGPIGVVVAIILGSVFAVEGGYVNNPKDPGGETNHGITKAVAVTHGYTAPMKVMPKTTAAEIYYKDYIVKPGFEPIINISPAVAEELVDSGVNMGPPRPSRWLQESLNALNRDGKDYPDIVVDGQVGPGTILAYQQLQKARGHILACQLIIKLLDAKQAVYYTSLTKMETFTPGWVSQRIGNVPLSKCTNYGGVFNAEIQTPQYSTN